MNELIAKFSVFTQQEFLFLGLAAILFFDSLYFLWNFFGTRSFIKKSSKASAIIAEVREIDDGKNKYQELTLIFKDSSGMEFAPVIDNKFKPRQRGERVDIYYMNNDPSNVVIAEWRALYMKSLVSFMSALMTIVIGYYLMGLGVLVIPKF